MTDLLSQVAEWSLRNFGENQASDLGVIEEIGELCHGLLKKFQGIRGFDDPAKFIAHTEDALADIGIYLLNFAGINGIMLAHTEVVTFPIGYTQRTCLHQLLMGCGQLLAFVDVHGCLLPITARTESDILQALLQMIWDWTNVLARFHDMDLRLIATKTWLKVRERDWAKNRTHAHVVAETGGVEVPKPGVNVPEPGALVASPAQIPAADANHYKAADQY